MMMRFTMATAAVLLGCGSAYAQARLNVSPLSFPKIISPRSDDAIRTKLV